MTKESIINEVITDPALGIMVPVPAYLMGVLIFRCSPYPAITPLPLVTFSIIVSLKISNVSYADYHVGGSCLNTFTVPSTVAPRVPPYRSFHLMKHHIRSILSGILIVCVVSTTFTALIAKTFGTKYLLAISLFPKSVTTVMAVGVTGKVGGITTATLVVAVIAGILISVPGPVFLKLLKIDDPVAIGLSPGGTGRVIGTGTALKYGYVEGTTAGPTIGATGTVYAIVSPIAAQVVLK